jgi:hypothetical protein
MVQPGAAVTTRPAAQTYPGKKDIPKDDTGEDPGEEKYDTTITFI